MSIAPWSSSAQILCAHHVASVNTQLSFAQSAFEWCRGPSHTESQGLVWKMYQVRNSLSIVQWAFLAHKCVCRHASSSESCAVYCHDGSLTSSATSACLHASCLHSLCGRWRTLSRARISCWLPMIVLLVSLAYIFLSSQLDSFAPRLAACDFWIARCFGRRQSAHLYCSYYTGTIRRLPWLCRTFLGQLS